MFFKKVSPVNDTFHATMKKTKSCLIRVRDAQGGVAGHRNEVRRLERKRNLEQPDRL